MRIHRAVRMGDLATVRWLIDADSSCIDRANWIGYTPLQLAAINGDKDLVTLLLDRGAVVDCGMGWTPLQLAISRGHASLVELFLHRNANVNATASNYSDTAIHVAVLANQLAFVKTLVGQDGNLNAQTRTGETPLHYAARDENREAIRLLISLGAVVSITDKQGRTALELARAEKNWTAIDELNSYDTSDTRSGTLKAGR